MTDDTARERLETWAEGEHDARMEYTALGSDSGQWLVKVGYEEGAISYDLNGQSQEGSSGSVAIEQACAAVLQRLAEIGIEVA